jgi:hypothetical protein
MRNEAIMNLSTGEPSRMGDLLLTSCSIADMMVDVWSLGWVVKFPLRGKFGFKARLEISHTLGVCGWKVGL